MNEIPKTTSEEKDTPKKRKSAISNWIKRVKQGNWGTKSDVVGWAVNAVVALITILLFIQVLRQNNLGENANKTSDASLKDQEQAARLQHISDSAKDVADSEKYVRDTTAENRRDVFDRDIRNREFEEQKALFESQQNQFAINLQIDRKRFTRDSILADKQIDAFDKEQERFQAENEAYLQAANFILHDSDKGHLPFITYDVFNEGKGVIQIERYKQAFGVFRNEVAFDTTIIDNKLDSDQFINDRSYIDTYTPAKEIYPIKNYFSDDVYDDIKEGKTKIFFSGEYDYTSLINQTKKKCRFIIAFHSIGTISYTIEKN